MDQEHQGPQRSVPQSAFERRWEENNLEIASMFTPFSFQPRWPATEGQWHIQTMNGSAACRVAVAQSKQEGWWREGRMCTEASVTDTRTPPATAGEWFPTRNLEFSKPKLQTITGKVQFSMISGINMKISLVPFQGGNLHLIATD